MKEETKYLYFHLEFNANNEYKGEFIAEDLEEVSMVIRQNEIELDDEELDFSITVKGVGLTRDHFNELRKEQNDFWKLKLEE